MANRYYSVSRPVSIGTYPKPEGNEVLEICNFDERRAVPAIGREAWGWVEYSSPLDESLASSYELVSEQELPPYVALAGRRDYSVLPAEVLEGAGLAVSATGVMVLDESGDVHELYRAAQYGEMRMAEAVLEAYGAKPLKPAIRAYRDRDGEAA